MPVIYKNAHRSAKLGWQRVVLSYSSCQFITVTRDTFRTTLDAKDVRIFCEIGFKYTDFNAPVERRISPSEIGKKVGLDEKTVRLRVKKMEEEGFVKYYQTIPNLALFNVRSTMFGFEASDISSKHEAIEALREMPEVVEIIDCVGEEFSATLAGTSNEEVQQLALETKNRLGLARALRVVDWPVITPGMTPSRLDWQIMQACRYDALCSATKIAEKLSITPRMVEYRISKLLESRTCFIKAMVDFQSQKGIIFCNMSIFADETEESLPNALRDLHGEKLWSLLPSRPLSSVFLKMGLKERLLSALMPHSGCVIANFFADTPGESEEAHMKTLKLKGVKRAYLSITKEFIEPRKPTWIDRLIEEKISAEDASQGQ